MIDVEQARAIAHSIAEVTLGADPGRLDEIESSSHQVFIGSTVAVKIVAAADHTRLDREIAITGDLPAGLSAPVLASGRMKAEGGDLLYACLGRVPGATPGMGLVGVDRVTARQWAQQAVRHLQRLHDWTPSDQTATVLRQSLDHGGFIGRSQLLSDIGNVRDLDDGEVLPRQILDALTAIADRAPEYPQVIVPVHADCHWGNWLVHERTVTALLDFEWARFGEPADDWLFLAGFSGPHMQTVLSVIADLTGVSLNPLQAACEVREAAYLTSDFLLELRNPHDSAQALTRIVRDLERLAVDRSWWQPTA